MNNQHETKASFCRSSSASEQKSHLQKLLKTHLKLLNKLKNLSSKLHVPNQEAINSLTICKLNGEPRNKHDSVSAILLLCWERYHNIETSKLLFKLSNPVENVKLEWT